MANHKQAAKRNRQRIKRQALSRHFRTYMRTYIKRFRAALTSKDVKAAEEALKAAIPAIDRCAQKGMIPFKRASRYVSRLSLAFNKINQD